MRQAVEQQGRNGAHAIRRHRSEVYQSIRLGRKGIGIELKSTYWQVGVRNLKRAESANVELPLFAGMEAGAA